MEDVPDDKVEDENYFSLMDMFICTRLDQYCLMFVLKIINMIHLSETFSFPSAKVLGSRRTSSGLIKSGCISFERKIFRELLVDFYVQLTTISWLSVRSVQRSSQPAQSREQKTESSGNIFDFLPSWSDFVPLASESSKLYQDQQAQSRAEERIRIAQELEANNSQARARLVLNKILR